MASGPETDNRQATTLRNTTALLTGPTSAAAMPPSCTCFVPSVPDRRRKETTYSVRANSDHVFHERPQDLLKLLL